MKRDQIMKKLLTGLFSISVLLSVQVQAYMWDVTPTLIETIDVRLDYIKVTLVDEHDNEDRCSGGDGGDAKRIIKIDSADQIFYSAVLSAYMGGKKIAFDTSGCELLWSTSGTFPKVVSIRIH